MYSNGIALVFDLAANITILSLAGHFLDDRTGHSPWYLLGGLVIGTIISFYRIYKFINQKD